MEIIPNWQVMLIVFVIFLITMFLLNKFVFQPLLSFMDQRDQKIAGDLHIVNQDDTELLRIEEEIRNVLTQAQAQAYALKEEQIEQARNIANAKIEKIHIENKEKMEAFLAKLHASRDEVKNEFKNNLGDIESLMAAKIRNA